MKYLLNRVAVNSRHFWMKVARRLGLSRYQIHQIYLQEKKLIYIPIPKNACSSLKQAFYQIEFGKQFDYSHNLKLGFHDIHDYYEKRNNAFTSLKRLKNNEDCRCFAVVRDPIDRLLSSYGNRVIDLKDLEASRKILEKINLPVEPDLNTFVLNLETYRKVNIGINHHVRLQSEFLGGTLEYLDQVYPFEKMKLVTQKLKSYDSKLVMKREKSDGAKFNINHLSPEALNFALEYYKKDYQLLEEFYSSKQVINRYEKFNKV